MGLTHNRGGPPSQDPSWWPMPPHFPIFTLCWVERASSTSQQGEAAGLLRWAVGASLGYLAAQWTPSSPELEQVFKGVACAQLSSGWPQTSALPCHLQHHVHLLGQVPASPGGPPVSQRRGVLPQSSLSHSHLVRSLGAELLRQDPQGSGGTLRCEAQGRWLPPLQERGCAVQGG